MSTEIRSADNEFGWRSGMKPLGGAVEPARDLWPDIALRLAAAAPARRRRWPLLAAAAALLVACGAGVLGWHLQHAAAQHDDTALTAFDWAQPANPKLAAAAETLDNASADLQSALEQHPDAVFLVGLLNRTNNQRMRLLQAPIQG
jgi:hypothetical protein